MRKSVVASFVLVALLLGGTTVVLSDGPGANGDPNISGTWVGKVKVKSHDMSGEDDNWKGKELVGVKVSQMGSSVQVTIFVEDGPSFEMKGVLGDGHFWMTGEGPDGPAMWVGHVKSKGKKIVGRFLAGEQAHAIEATITVKRLKDEM